MDADSRVKICNKCGNCTTFCVHQGRPYRDKPRLFLDRAAFEAETENAYRLDLGAQQSGISPVQLVGRELPGPRQVRLQAEDEARLRVEQELQAEAEKRAGVEAKLKAADAQFDANINQIDEWMNDHNL